MKPAPHPAPDTPEHRHLTGRDRSFWHRRWFSLCAAIVGVVHTMRSEPSAWIELGIAGVVGLAGWWFELRAVEWAILTIVIFLVLALEAINTAVEATVDLLSPGYHPLAKIAKDTAAGAVLLMALGSIVVGLIIFGPRLWVLFFAGA